MLCWQLNIAQIVLSNKNALGLLTVTVHDGYTGSVIRHPSRPVAPLALQIDGTAYAACTVIPVEIRLTVSTAVLLVCVQSVMFSAVQGRKTWAGKYG